MTGTPDWLKSGRGTTPEQRWSFATDAKLTALKLARETGDVLAADDSGGLYLLDRRGRVQALTRTSHRIRVVDIADDGSAGVAILDDSTVAWFDRRLQFRWQRNVTDGAVGLAISSHGTHAAVSLDSGLNVIYDADQRRVATFESMRPLRYLQLATTEPGLIAAADYGYFAWYNFSGDVEWSERLWSTVNDLTATGDGRTITLAGLAHGLMVYDRNGRAQGSFLCDGTVHAVSSTYARKQWIAATLERQLMVVDGEGTLRWQAQSPDDIMRVQASPLGDYFIVGFSNGRIVRLDA